MRDEYDIKALNPRRNPYVKSSKQKFDGNKMIMNIKNDLNEFDIQNKSEWDPVLERNRMRFLPSIR